MQIIQPNWIRPTDTLGSIQAGSQVGLALRAAMERERAARAEEAMQAERMAAAEQAASERLRQEYWQAALQKGMQEQLRGDRLAAGEAERLDRSTAADALSKYRMDTLKLRENELAKRSEPKPFVKRAFDAGGNVWIEKAPGEVEMVSGSQSRTSEPMIRGVSLVPGRNVNVPKGDFKIGDPLLNQLMPGNRLVGTNYTGRAPSVLEAPTALAAPTAPTASVDRMETPEQIRELYRTKKISREEAKRRIEALGVQ